MSEHSRYLVPSVPNLHGFAEQVIAYRTFMLRDCMKRKAAHHDANPDSCSARMKRRKITTEADGERATSQDRHQEAATTTTTNHEAHIDELQAHIERLQNQLEEETAARNAEIAKNVAMRARFEKLLDAYLELNAEIAKNVALRARLEELQVDSEDHVEA